MFFTFILTDCASIQQNSTVVAKTQSVISLPNSPERTSKYINANDIDQKETTPSVIGIILGILVASASAGVVAVAVTPMTVFLAPTIISGILINSNQNNDDYYTYENKIEKLARNCVAEFLNKHYKDEKKFDIILKEGEIQITVISNSGCILEGEANWEKFHIRITFNLKSNYIKLDYTLDGYYASGFKEYIPKEFTPFNEDQLSKLQSYIDKLASEVEDNFDIKAAEKCTK